MIKFKHPNPTGYIIALISVYISLVSAIMFIDGIVWIAADNFYGYEWLSDKGALMVYYLSIFMVAPIYIYDGFKGKEK